MHVLLIYPNRPRLTYGELPGPYGLEILRARLALLDVDCQIVNPFLARDPSECLRQAIRGDTALVGVSIRNLDDALTFWNPGVSSGSPQTVSCLDDIKEVLGLLCRWAAGIPVVLGGAAFGPMAGPLLDYLEADVGLVGAAEEDFTRLVAAMARKGWSFGRAVQDLPSAAFRPPHNGSPRPAAVSLSPPLPVIEREAVYFRFRPEAAVRTFTGCPLNCSHCIEHVVTRTIRRSPLEIVADEVEGVVNRYPEVRRIFFADSEVNLAGEERTTALIRTIRSRPAASDVRLVGYFNPRPLSFEFLRTLAQAGCEVRLTVDHVTDVILSRNGKNFRNRHLRELVSFHERLGLPLSFCLILGQPGETKATVDEVLRFVEAIPTAIRGPVYFSAGVRVYPGTPIERMLSCGLLDHRWLVSPDTGEPPFVKPVIYCESWNPFELFDYVQSRAGVLIRPMNSYLAGYDAAELERANTVFHNYSIGLAARDEDDATAWALWSTLGDDVRFLPTAQRNELLWARGRLALERGFTDLALDDWGQLKSSLLRQQTHEMILERVEHNLSVAGQILAASSP